MEFLIGAATTLACVIILNKFAEKNISRYKKSVDVRDRQSKRFDILKTAYFIMEALQPVEDIDTQATRFFDSRSTTVALIEDKAYWIEDNVLFETEVIDGDFQKEFAKKVDTMTMDKLELNKISYIVEKLTEAKNDRGYPGKSYF
jgi:thymidylate synthase